MDGKVIIIICSVVALSSACCTPDQWEGIEAGNGGYADRRRHGAIKEFIKVSYDAVNNRTAAFVDYRNGHISAKYKIVTRYDAEGGKVYVLDIKKDKCYTKNLERPFRKACIPDDVKPVGNYFIGLSGGLNVTGYEIRFKSLEIFVSVEQKNNKCVPVGESVQGRIRNVDFIQNIGFLNITQGIKNETVFDIPEKCQKRVEDDVLPEELTREHYIMAI